MMSGSANPGETGASYRDHFDRTIAGTLSKAVRMIASDPALVLYGTRILRHQAAAARIRATHERNGLLVPPVMILSITSRCNLACAGCYMHGRHESPGTMEMSGPLIHSIASQAADLGVSVIVIAGGEPLVRLDEIASIATAHPRILFPVFTNGLLIDDMVADRIAEIKNIVPVISFEGESDRTDARRGSGVFSRLMEVTARLRSRRVFFGCSVTITRDNFPQVTGDTFIREMAGAGARAFVFVEYVPMTPGTGSLVLSQEQKDALPNILAGLEDRYPALFIGFPGNEDEYGGCLAAGRGFVHISPSGNLEPCPAAPYSDTNLAKVPLKEALQSPFLARLRENPAVLAESEGGCALRANRAWVQELVSGEYKAA